MKNHVKYTVRCKRSMYPDNVQCFYTHTVVSHILMLASL